jgi:hypothetical protein
VVVPKGAAIKFTPPKHLEWGKNTRMDELNAQAEELWRTYNIRLGCQYNTSHPQVTYKSLKTIDKYRIKLDNIALPTKILSPVLQRHNTPCNCPPEYLQSYIDNCWDWVVKFACRICGKIYLCDCFEEAMKNFLPKAEDASCEYSEEGWPNRFIETYTQRNFRRGICHICRGVPSDLTYCNEMYGNEFTVKYGSYVQRIANEKVIDSRQAEDILRDSLGILRSDKWISEIELYKHIKELFPNEKVIHQARPVWLSPQSLDIFIPAQNLAIEYQGLQHYQPVEFFGGEDAFFKTKERDKRKSKKCAENKVALIYFRYDEEINNQLIKYKVKKALGNCAL